LTTDTASDTELQQLEDELKLLTSNTTTFDQQADIDDNAVAVERANRAARPTSGRRYSGNRNATTSTGSGRWRSRLRQRPGAARKQQKGGRQRTGSRGRKFRGKGKNRMRTQQKGSGSGRRLKSKNATMSVSDREQSDAAYNAPPKSGLGGSLSAEGQEEMTNTLEPSDNRKQQQRPGDPYQPPRSCIEMRCQRGGHCVMDDRQGRPRARCQCPLGTKGHHCETGQRPILLLSVSLQASHF